MLRMAALCKSEMQYIIKLAGASIYVDTPFPMHSSRETDEFIRPAANGEDADLRFEMLPSNHLPEVEDVRYEDERRIYVGTGKSAATFFRGYVDYPPYAYVPRADVREGHLHCMYIAGNETFMDYTRNLIGLLDIEATLLDFEALILHASMIRYNSQGIIFTAPSGTGKSTQASLWEQYEDAEVLNGDRAALRKINGVWTTYGLPYAGTSGIYRNEYAPLCAVVTLRQAKENRIRRVAGAEAFRFLYPETMIHRWDKDFEQRATDLLLKLMNDVPVFLLECRPDREAVELLRDTLQTISDKE